MQRSAGDAKLVVAHHFFWSAGTVMQKSQTGLLRTICFDILRRCPSLIPVVCKDRHEQTGVVPLEQSWTLSELQGLLAFLLTQEDITQGQASRKLRFAFFIDGLDEYEGDHHDIIDTIKRVATSKFVKVCVASRPWNVFQYAFGNDKSMMLRVQDLTRDDINHYVNSKLRENDRFKAMIQGNPQCLQIVNEVTTKANGGFLWVSLVVKELLRSLDNSDGINDLFRRLRDMPPGLEEYFRHMFDTIDAFYSQQTARILQVCLHARHPLSLISFVVVEPDAIDFGIRPSPMGFGPDSHFQGAISQAECEM